MTDYTPSPAAVETMARAIYHAPAHSYAWEDAEESLRRHYRNLAAHALVALMEATVTEPCATCGGTGEGTSWIDHGASLEAGAPIRRTDPCLACNATGESSPRSLAVIECEKAGLLPTAVCTKCGWQGSITVDGVCPRCPYALVNVKNGRPPSPTEREEP